MNTIRLQCGCELEKNAKGNPVLDLDNLRLDCPLVWQIYEKGLTKGIFQLETQLGIAWSKKLKPTNIEHLAALVALLRPGTLNAKDENGVSMTEHYVRRKNGLEPIEYLHESLRPHTENTYGILTFQESIISMARDLAGFSLTEADALRKSIGKKIPALLAECRTLFIEKARERKVISEEDANKIFDIVNKSSRYLFNRSHAVSYGILSYITAYIKSHFPAQFFAAWLFHANEQQDPLQETNELVNNAKLFDIEITPPNLNYLNKHFIFSDNKIVFGLTDIKGIGYSQMEKLMEVMLIHQELIKKPIIEWNFFNFLIAAMDINKTVGRALIESGALDLFKCNRTRMLAEYLIVENFTKKEKEWLKKHWSHYISLEELLEDVQLKNQGGIASNIKRKAYLESAYYTLKNPPFPLEDTPHYIAWSEKERLGIPLTFTCVDGKDLRYATCTCKEFLAGKKGYLVIGAEVQRVTEQQTKNGKNKGSYFGFLTLFDKTASIEAVAWPEAWKEYKGLFQINNVILAQGNCSKTGTFVIEKARQL